MVEGMDVLVAVAKTPVNKKKEPETKTGLTIDIEIADCGQLPDEQCRFREEEELAVGAIKLAGEGAEGAPQSVGDGGGSG